MAHPLKHAESSARRFGGKSEDYLSIHNWFDESKSFFTDFRHRALRHHAEGIFLAERIFGITIVNSDGELVVYDAYRGEENGMLFAHEQAEILQMEDLATSKDTVWNEPEGFGRNFCAFIERVAEEKRLRDLAAKKKKADNPEAQPGSANWRFVKEFISVRNPGPQSLHASAEKSLLTSLRR